MDSVNIIKSSLRLLSKPQREAYQAALTQADGGTNGDGILTKEEFNKGNEAFFKTDAFTQLTAADQQSFKERIKADAVWGQQGALTYDGNKLQIEYYERALRDGKKDKDGNPIVTKEQLEYARNNGFGNIDGKNGIDGLELAVANIDGDKTNGDITGDGKVNKDDRGVDFRTPEAKAGGKSGGGVKFDTNAIMGFLDKLMTIWNLK